MEHSSLFYGDTIRSQRGAQQGDPLGPLLFSLTIHQMALELKGHPGLDGTLWYLDDGSLRGSPKAVFDDRFKEFSRADFHPSPPTPTAPVQPSRQEKTGVN